MRHPDICKVVIDESVGVTYHIMAYRELTDAEAVRVVRTYLLNTSHRKRPKSGMTVTIVTVIGCVPGL